MPVTKRYIPVVFLLAVMIGIQITTSLTQTSYYLTQLTMSVYYALVVIGLCLVMGYAGQISLGHAGFFAMGGYLSAALTTCNLSAWQSRFWFSPLVKLHVISGHLDGYGLPILSVSPWMACIIAVLITIAAAFILGIPVLKLKGHYLAMATLGFGVIVYRIVLGSRVFGEADGISCVPGFTLLPGLRVCGDLSAKTSNYYIACGILILSMTFLLNLIHSRVGRALRAIHGAEDAANAMGVDTARYKLYAFVLSAALASIGGVLLTHYNGGIGPSEAGIMKSVRYVAIVAVGGMGNLWGSLLMAILLNFLSLRDAFGSYDDAVFGAILILVMLFAPDGLLKLSAGPVFQKWRLRFRAIAGSSSTLKSR